MSRSRATSLRAVILAAWAFTAPPLAAAATIVDRFPGAEWDQTTPAQAGWSAAKLEQAQAFSRQIGTSAIVIVQHGVIVASWGEPATALTLYSVRKSLLSALIGIAVANHQIDLHDTLAKLGIDDKPPALTPEEKQATVGDLLEARSGIYHGANYETAQEVELRPARGSHPPGTFWYYNNWDFNALGGIYEHATGTPIFTAFDQRIARPLGMQDFNPAACRYYPGPDSNYPAYLFSVSARDLARFGLLYLHRGQWAGRQIIPAQWVDDSAKPYSRTERGFGYGYLWWVALPSSDGGNTPVAQAMNLPPGSYFAMGNHGQRIFVIPAADMVVIHLARADPSGGGGTPRVAQLMGLILDAAGAH